MALAERLLAGSADEADRRTAISRAYYAAYHAAAAFVRARGLLVSGQTHTKVWQALVTDASPDRTDVGVRGAQLKWVREQADYRTPFPGNLDNESRAAIIEARAILAALQRLG